LAFYFLGVFLLSSGKRQLKFFWFLAVCIGIGFYTYTAWPVVAVMVALPIILKTRHQIPESIKKLIAFILIPLLLSVPLIHARLSTGGTSYLQNLWGHPAGLDYVEALFWNGLGITQDDPSKFGWLNPCLGALFLIGFLELWRFRLSKIAQWSLLAVFLFLLPGVFTNYVEMYRIIPLLPVIAVLAALGIHALLSQRVLSNEKKIIFFILLAVLSLGLDIYHYCGSGQFQDWNYFIRNKRHWMTVDFSRAYQQLNAARDRGLRFGVLSDLNNNNANQTLDIVSSPLDAFQKPVSENPSVQSAVLLINCNYEPFLKREFPDSRWTWLSPDLPNDYGGLTLGFIPLDSHTGPILERWKKANGIFKQNNDLYMEHISGQSVDPILNDLYAHYALFQGDRFLESVFWEKVAFYEEFQMKIPEAVAALKKAAQDGYAAAELYNKLGVLTALLGNQEEAEGYFEKALCCPVNRTTAAENLKRLQGMEKGKLSPLADS
jgi:hypothetical protein